MSKFTTQPRLIDAESRRQAVPSLPTLSTRILPSAEHQAGETGTSRRSSLRRAEESTSVDSGAPPRSESIFEYVRALEAAELSEMRESPQGVARVPLPMLEGYESGEIRVELDLPAERIRATGLDRLAFTLTADPSADGMYRLAPASDTEVSLIELLQAKLRRVTILLRRATPEGAEAAEDPTAYGPHPKAVHIGLLTLSAVGRMAVVPAF